MTLDPDTVWAGIGLVGQAAFTARFVVQWIASERKKETVVPVAFWWCSLGGGLIMLTYTIHLRSLALSLGQGMGLVVYVRNLMIVSGARKAAARRHPRAGDEAAPPRPHHRAEGSRRSPGERSGARRLGGQAE
jgi:lipid-A-disaccharide synthase-like uncharacterized protein